MSLKICVVDDFLSMRKALKRVFQNEKETVVFDFGTAQETIDFLEKNHVDIVICDIYLQKGSGFDVLRYVRNRPILPDLPVIFVTGEGTKDDIVYSIDLGVNDYVLKPFEAQELLSKVKQAVEKFNNPSRTERLIRQAEALLIDGQFDDAAALFISTKSAAGTMVPRAAVGLCRVDILRGDNAAALKRLRQTIDDHPMYFPAYTVIVDLYLSLGRKFDATDCLIKELEINGKQPHRRMMLADLFIEAGESEKALAQMRQAIVDHPKDERLLLKMANIYMDLSDNERALHYFLKTRRVVKTSRDALQGIVDVCMKTGELKKGVGLLTDQLTVNKSAAEVFLYRAKLHEKMENLESALGDVEAYLLNHDSDSDAIRFKAKLLGAMGRYAEQADNYIRLSQLASLPENFARAGLACIKAERYGDAVLNYKKAVAADQANLKYRFNLAFAYEQTGEIDKAIAMIQTVLKIDPSHAEAHDFLKRLKVAG